MDYAKIIELVKQASQMVFSKDLKDSVNMKGEADFVTAVDLGISSFIKNELSKLTPQIGFVSEEGDNNEKSQKWILDPIDGTTNLVYDYNMSSVSLALCVEGEVVFGVIYNPFNKDLFTAEKGKGAYLNGRLLGTAPDRNLEKCLIEFGAGSTRKAQADATFELAKNVFKGCLDLRRICSSALAICYVAAGKLNGYFEAHLKPWDYAAATLILDECGGICSDWQGNAIQFDVPSSYVCGTPKAYQYLMAKIHDSLK